MQVSSLFVFSSSRLRIRQRRLSSLHTSLRDAITRAQRPRIVRSCASPMLEPRVQRDTAIEPRHGAPLHALRGHAQLQGERLTLIASRHSLANRRQWSFCQHAAAPAESSTPHACMPLRVVLPRSGQLIASAERLSCCCAAKACSRPLGEPRVLCLEWSLHSKPEFEFEC